MTPGIASTTLRLTILRSPGIPTWRGRAAWGCGGVDAVKEASQMSDEATEFLDARGHPERRALLVPWSMDGAERGSSMKGRSSAGAPRAWDLWSPGRGGRRHFGWGRCSWHGGAARRPMRQRQLGRRLTQLGAHASRDREGLSPVDDPFASFSLSLPRPWP